MTNHEIQIANDGSGGGATRRRMLRLPLVIASGSLALLIGASSYAEDAKPATPAVAAVADAGPASVDAAFERDEVDTAIDKAVAFFMARQHEEGWINHQGHNQTAMTSLALMAMAAAGHMPNDPTPQGKSMARALAYVLRDDRIEDTGYFGNRDGSRMYGHGIITLMLTEMLGHGVDREQDALIRKRCQAAVGLILRSQKVPKDAGQTGGWRYAPDSRDSDLSVTVWQVMALRSAHNAGLDVPVGAVDAAVEYLKRSYASQRDKEGNPIEKDSAFVYMVQGDGAWRGVRDGKQMASASTAAAGLLAMQVCGKYESPEVAGAADWLMEKPPKWGETWFYYASYYYAQGMYQRGGEHADTASRVMRDIVLPQQEADGSWKVYGSEQGAGPVYSTSLAVLSLAVKCHYLPIYQR